MPAGEWISREMGCRLQALSVSICGTKMTKTYCDRCGGEYSGIFAADIAEVHEANHQKSAAVVQVLSSIDYLGHQTFRGFELCGKCVIDLRNFMKLEKW